MNRSFHRQFIPEFKPFAVAIGGLKPANLPESPKPNKLGAAQAKRERKAERNRRLQP